MVSMAQGKMEMLVILFFFVQGLVAMSFDQETILSKINKPAVRSFKTKYGDILDCVDIHKQLAFDHPLLRNHSIQMKPTGITTEISDPLKPAMAQQILPRNVRCPKGTVIVRRMQKEDISQSNFSRFWVSPMSSNSSNSAHQDAAQPGQGHQVATLSVRMKNIGVHGNLNVWEPSVAANQFSSALIFAASDDGSAQNYISAGWSVNSDLYPSSTRLFTFWTTDSGKTTGCFNLVCPGFVQVSQEVAPGIVIQPVSTFGGAQYEIQLSIRQDMTTGNWWVNYGGKYVGYYPQQLFMTMRTGADGVGWGGEVASPATEPLPGMGSGHFPELGPQKACYISQMELFSISGEVILPNSSVIQTFQSKPECYKVLYGGDVSLQFGHFMYFGGPSDCKI